MLLQIVKKEVFDCENAWRASLSLWQHDSLFLDCYGAFTLTRDDGDCSAQHPSVTLFHQRRSAAAISLLPGRGWSELL